MRFDILTIFPNIFDSYLQESIIKRALQAGKIEIHIHDIRASSKDKHHKVDAPPFGGGPGMVMMAQPIYDCIQTVKKLNGGPVIYMSPRGKILTQRGAEKLYKKISGHERNAGVSKKGSQTGKNGLILLCGRYEGVDQRVIDMMVDVELSIGK
jgi:tRNA (guanine37-N1)-methyltransferase